LKLKLFIVFKSWTEKLHFSIVANTLKISVRGFFANLILCPLVLHRGTPFVAKQMALSTIELKYLHNIPFVVDCGIQTKISSLLLNKT
jgi:hypothetical protein